MQASLYDGRLLVMSGDITRLDVDVIVNAANSSLLGGGGVDGAIHRAAGKALREACSALRTRDWPEGLPAGEVALTPGFALPAHYVIHTVGPVYAAAQNPSAELAACYRNALALAEMKNLHSIAFPAISTGIYGYPLEGASAVVLDVMAEELPKRPGLSVTLCFYRQDDAETFLAVAREKGVEVAT